MKTLRSSTAIALCVALSMPHPVIAAEHAGMNQCGDTPEPPCLLDDGIELTLGETEGVDQCPDPLNADATPCVTPEGFLAEAADENTDTEMTEEAETEDTDTADEDVADETPSEDAPAEAASAEAEAEAETEATADAAATESETDVEAEATAETAETEAEVETDTAAEAEAEVTTEEAASDEETAADEETQTATDEAAEAEETPAESAEAAPSEDAATEAPADQAAEADEALAEETTETYAKANAEATTEADATAEAEATAEADATVDADATAEAEAEVEDVIEEEAPAAAAAAMTEDTETASEDADVATEEVTEDTARSSSEDFETSATGDVSATASAEVDGDSGLSNFEKALLLGLGAVAVGSILQNGEEVVSNSGDRVVLRDESGDLRVLKDDDALLRQPGSQVRTETFNDGSTRTIVTRDDGTRIITIRAADGRVLRRSREFPDGSRVVLFDDTETAEPVVVSELPEVTRQSIDVDVTDEDALRRALAEAQQDELSRRFSLRQVRQIREVRELAPEIELDAITFATGSAAIAPSQAEELAALGRAMRRIIDERPGEVFLIEGHTDAVGDATYNLALSDRRAETVALALTEYFDVPPENMITQGYGESALKVPTQEAERLNRRAAVRRITPLLRQAALDN